MNKIILGGGIAGLIYAFYNRDCRIISPEFGGQISSHFALGPRFLHKNEFSIKFLQDLNLPIEPTIIRTGYQTTKNYFVDSMRDEKFKQRYYMKSRGLKTLEGYDETAMSGGKNCFEALKVDFGIVIKKLCEACKDRLIKAKVIRIEAKDRVIYTDRSGIFAYEHLINTMPLNIFADLLGSEAGFPKAEYFKCSPITYVLLHPQPKCGFDYVYVAQGNVPHHRLTWDEKGVVAEWFGNHSMDACIQAYGVKYVDSKILWNAQIIPIKELPVLDRVKFLGRYGTWNRHWKTETVIEEAMKDGIK